MSNPFARSSLRWVSVVNIDDEPAPPYGLLAPAGVDDAGRIQVTRPTQNSQEGLLINGPGQIPPGIAGQAHKTFPALVAFDNGGDDGELPGNGQNWGSIAPDGVRNAWQLQPNQKGFVIIGGAAEGLVTVSSASISELSNYVQPTSTSPSQITLGRTITDAILNGTTTLVSPQQGKFTEKDEGATVVGTGIPANTTIVTVSNATTAIMSASASAGTNVTVKIETGSKKGYSAVINYQDPVYGSWKRRTITDVSLTATNTTLSSALDGQFTLGDTGATLTGNGIPANTTATFSSSTALTMSNAASSNETNDTVVIQQGTLQTCWLVQGNDSVWYPGPVAGPTPMPVYTAINYDCRFFQNDVNGVPIYEVASREPNYSQTFLGSVSLGTSYANTGLSVTLQPNTIWMLSTQITAQISSSATSTGSDSISFQYFDSVNSVGYGASVTCANAICASITFEDAAPLIAIVAVGSETITVNVQGKVNTSTGSTGSMIGGNLVAVQIQPVG